MTKLNLGCGQDYRKGYWNVDSENVHADEQADLRILPWRWPDNSAEEIMMNGVLEHLPDTIGTVNEVWRVLEHGGLFVGSYPFCASTFAFRDPSHVRYFDEKIWDYWDFWKNRVPWAGKARFHILEVKLFAYRDTPGQKLRNLIPFRRYLKWFLNNMYDRVDFRVRAMK